MPFLKRRDKILIFRLTQDEYDNLTNACQEQGGRNLSDFARTQLLQRVETAGPDAELGQRLHNVEGQLTELKSSLQNVTSILERISAYNPGK